MITYINKSELDESISHDEIMKELRKLDRIAFETNAPICLIYEHGYGLSVHYLPDFDLNRRYIKGINGELVPFSHIATAIPEKDIH